MVRYQDAPALNLYCVGRCKHITSSHYFEQVHASSYNGFAMFCKWMLSDFVDGQIVQEARKSHQRHAHLTDCDKNLQGGYDEHDEEASSYAHLKFRGTFTRSRQHKVSRPHEKPSASPVFRSPRCSNRGGLFSVQRDCFRRRLGSWMGKEPRPGFRAPMSPVVPMVYNYQQSGL